MEKRFKIDENQEFVIIYDTDSYFGKRVAGTCYPCDTLEVDNNYFTFRSKKDGSSTNDVKEADVTFNFSFVWRGVWEGRIYFESENELFHEELKYLHLIWNEIETHLKAEIRAKFSNDEMED